MREERLAVEIREAFDQGYEPNRGLEERVVAAIPWEEPRRSRSVSWPRVGGAFAGAVALVLIGVLVVPAVLTRLNVPFPGSSGNYQPPAYSLAAVTSDSLFVVQRGPMTPDELLLQSKDGGRTWVERLRFTSIYDGMQMFGQVGYIWGIDMAGRNCGSMDSSCMPHTPTFQLDLYRTSDGGATWTALPSPHIAANDVFFLDERHGWLDSGSPATGLGNDELYTTTDGGQTWSLVGALPQPAPMGWVYGVGKYRVTFSTPLRGWCVGDNVLFTTHDGGHSWQSLYLSLPAGVRAPSQPFINGLDGILPIAGRDPNGPDNATPNQLFFYISHDGGATWAGPRIGPAGFAPVGDDLTFAILDPQHIWLTSQSVSGGDNVQAAPAVARTADGGLSWTVVHETPRILQMTFRDATHGYALDVTGESDVNGILSTQDGGATWQRVNVPVFS